jgi:ketosteroid isomerase-like protein
MTGASSISSIFAPDMRWEVVGRSAVSRTYDTPQQFIDEAMRPVAARFREDGPFRPVGIRGIYSDEDEHTVAVVWDGGGTTIAGTPYLNTYAWFLTLRGAEIVHGMSFYDSITFNELWEAVTPPS